MRDGELVARHSQQVLQVLLAGGGQGVLPHRMRQLVAAAAALREEAVLTDVQVRTLLTPEVEPLDRVGATNAALDTMLYPLDSRESVERGDPDQGFRLHEHPPCEFFREDPQVGSVLPPDLAQERLVAGTDGSVSEHQGLLQECGDAHQVCEELSERVSVQSLRRPSVRCQLEQVPVLLRQRGD